jgi:hypothetical protein
MSTATPAGAPHVAADGTADGTAPPDPVMAAITASVGAGHSGDAAGARARLLSLWDAIGVAGDPLHRCTLAHYLADLYGDPAEALTWDIRALDAADALTDDRVKRHHGSLRVDGFYPSLHLNLADNYRRLGAFDAAGRHLEAARAHAPSLPGGGYGDQVRAAITGVAAAVARRDTAPRASAPGPAS